MKTLSIVIGLIISANIFAQDQQIIKGEIVDLTHSFSEESVYWVTAKEFQLEEVASGLTDAGFYYSANNFTTAEHGGTHIDAPIHFAENKQSVDLIPLENLIGTGVKINVQDKALKNPDYLISIEDINNWESKNGKIPMESIILFQTGYGKFYPEAKKYLGTDKRGSDAVKELHFPGLSVEAANWLIEKRNIKAVGLDTASIDHGQSKDFATHVALMTQNVPAFENVANLDNLPEKGFQIIALPMKIKGGSGGPLRIIAIK